MTERIIKEINTEKQLLAEPEPVNIAEWDAALCAELDSQNDPPAAPPDHDTEMPQASTKQSEQPGKKTPQKGKEKLQGRRPTATPTKVSLENKWKKPAQNTPSKTPQSDPTSPFTVGGPKGKGRGKGGETKNSRSRGKK